MEHLTWPDAFVISIVVLALSTIMCTLITGGRYPWHKD